MGTWVALTVWVISLGPPAERDAATVEECLSRVKEIHGGTGPWAVAGYRIGERALKDLELPRRSFRVLVVHYAPAEVQYSCVADGLQAATGASAGKLNLKLESAPIEQLRAVVSDRETGRQLVFTLRPDFVKSILDVPYDRLEIEGRRVAKLPDDRIFAVKDLQ